MFDYFIGLRVRGKIEYFDSKNQFIDINIQKEEAIRIRNFINHCLELEKEENAKSSR